METPCYRLVDGQGRHLELTGAIHIGDKSYYEGLNEHFKGFDAVQWYGTVGPAGLPADVVRRLYETQATVLKSPELAEKLTSEAVEPWSMPPEEFSRYIAAEVSRWTKLARARNIHLDE